MACSPNVNLVPRLYKSVIEDVISNVHDFFLEEGIDDHVLKDLKQLWESKLLQSRAVEGFFRENNHQQIMLELQQQKTHQTVHTSSEIHKFCTTDRQWIPYGSKSYSTGDLEKLADQAILDKELHEPQTRASIVIPAGRSVQNFTSADLNASGATTTLALPSGIGLPIQVPAGVTLQTASGHMYKVNVPVMVTQSAAGQKYFQQPVRHFIQQVNPVTGQTALFQQNSVSSQTHVIQQTSQDQAPTLQQSNSGQVSTHQQLLTNQSFDVANQSVLQQPGISRHLYIQQQGTMKQVVLQHTGMGVQTGPPIVIQRQSIANTGTLAQHVISTQPTQLEQSVEEQVTTGQTQHLLIQNSDNAPPAHTLIVQNQASEPNEGTNIPQCVSEQCVVQQFTPQVNETLLMVATTSEEQPIKVETSSIPQLDGTNDTSSDEEIGNLREVEENDILGIIDAEDLKALEGYDEDDSSSPDTSSDGSDEEPKEEIIEEDPLNSGDDVSEQEVPDLFDTDNVIVCQYDKIHRSKNKWKFYLKDGIMTFNGRDYVFSKAVGDAEW